MNRAHFFCSLVFLLSLYFIKSDAQESIIGKTYITNVPVYIRHHTPGQSKKGDKASKISYVANFDYKFVVEDIDTATNNYIIEFWSFNESYTYPNKFSATKRKWTMVDNKTNDEEFLLSPSDLSKKCSEYFPKANSFTSGAIYLPIKLRFGQKTTNATYFNFEEKLNLGIAAGWQHQFQSRKEQYTDLLFTFAVSVVSVDSLSLNDQQYYNRNSLTQPAFSIAIGYLYQYKTFQLGVFTGADWLPSKIGTFWKYQGKPWLGLGIGISLFNPTDFKATSPGTNKAS